MGALFLIGFASTGLAQESGGSPEAQLVPPTTTSGEETPSPTPETDSAAVPAPAAVVAAPAEPLGKRPTKVVLMDLEARNVKREAAQIINRVVASEIGKFNRDIDLITSDDVRRALAYESDKASLGCDEDACLAEIASSFGARYIIFGDMGRLGSRTLVHLHLFDQDEARAVSRRDITVTEIDDVQPAIAPAIRELLVPIIGQTVGPEIAQTPTPKQPQPVAATAVAESSSARIALLYAGGIVGVLGLAAAVIGIAVAGGSIGVLSTPTTGGDIKGYALFGELGGIIAGGVGLVVTLAGAGVYVAGHLLE